MKKNNFYASIFFLLINILSAQELPYRTLQVFTKQDTLRGSITKERIWWDLKKYHLDIKVNPNDSTIVGSNTIDYQVLKSFNVMQIDLQNPMQITKVVQDNVNLDYKREGNVCYIYLIAHQNPRAIKKITIFYEGKPKVAVNPPWDGGITWTKDENGKSFIASTCQGLGASVWWPNKDHAYDEVASMTMSINVPKNLVAVSNGRLQSIQQISDNTTTYN